jgi:hypothetical protein
MCGGAPTVARASHRDDGRDVRCRSPGRVGIALLAAYTRAHTDGQTLANYLTSRMFAGSSLETIQPDPADVVGFDAYVKRFSADLPLERAAVANG